MTYARILNAEAPPAQSRPGRVVITDPPFNVGYHYRSFTDRRPQEQYLEDLVARLGENFVLIHYPETVFDVARRIDRSPTRTVAWVYPSNTARQHRMIAWFGVAPDFRRVGQPYKNPKDKRVAKLIAQGREARLYDWWEINQVKNVSAEKTAHPCQMPFEVMRRVVGITPARSIVDPYAGSGTTLVAAQHWGIPSLGYEIDPVYAKIAQSRLV